MRNSAVPTAAMASAPSRLASSTMSLIALRGPCQWLGLDRVVRVAALAQTRHLGAINDALPRPVGVALADMELDELVPTSMTA